MTEFDLTDDQVNEIRGLFARLTATKNIIKELTSSDSNDVLDRLMNDLAQTQYKYDKWFLDMEKKLGAVTLPTNKWDVDFDQKKLRLM